MQKLWEKTKESVTYGVGAAMDFTGAKKLQEDPEFTKRWEKLEFIETHAKNLQKALLGFSVSLTNLGDAQVETATQYSKAFEKESGALSDYSKSLQSASEKCRTITQTAKSKMPEEVIKPLDDLLKEVARLKHEADKRKKNLILLEAQEPKYQKAQAKGKVKPELEKTVIEKRGKYQKHHSAFLQGVDALDARKSEIFKNVMVAHQRALTDVVNQLKETFSDDLANDPLASEQSFPTVA